MCGDMLTRIVVVITIYGYIVSLCCISKTNIIYITCIQLQNCYIIINDISLSIYHYYTNNNIIITDF